MKKTNFQKIGITQLTLLLFFGVLVGTIGMLIFVQRFFGGIDGLDATGNVVAAAIGIPVTASLACAAVLIGLRVEETQRDVACIESARLTHELQAEFSAVISACQQASFSYRRARYETGLLVGSSDPKSELRSSLAAFVMEDQNRNEEDIVAEPSIALVNASINPDSWDNSDSFDDNSIGALDELIGKIDRNSIAPRTAETSKKAVLDIQAACQQIFSSGLATQYLTKKSAHLNLSDLEYLAWGDLKSPAGLRSMIANSAYSHDEQGEPFINLVDYCGLYAGTSLEGARIAARVIHGFEKAFDAPNRPQIADWLTRTMLEIIYGEPFAEQKSARSAKAEMLKRHIEHTLQYVTVAVREKPKKDV